MKRKLVAASPGSAGARSNAKRCVGTIAGIVVAGIAALALRVVFEGRDALAEGDEAMAAKRPADAIAAWEASARWYLPFAPHVDEAYDRLRETARKHDSLLAWRAIRSAALATRSLWTPHADDLAEANARIAALSVADPDASPAPVGPPAATPEADKAQRLAWHQDRLAIATRPSKPAAALAIIGILAWLVGIGLLVAPHASMRVVRIAGREVKRSVFVAGVLTAGGILAWLVGLYSG